MINKHVNMFAQSIHPFRQWPVWSIKPQLEWRPEMTRQLNYELHSQNGLFVLSINFPIKLCFSTTSYKRGTGLAIPHSQWPVGSREHASVAKWERDTDLPPPGSNDSAIDTGFNRLDSDRRRHWTRVDLIYFILHIHSTPLAVTCKSFSAWVPSPLKWCRLRMFYFELRQRGESVCNKGKKTCLHAAFHCL